MTEYEMFMTMINRVYVSDLKNHTYWFNFGEDIDGNIKDVFIEDNADNCFHFEFDEKGNLINIY